MFSAPGGLGAGDWHFLIWCLETICDIATAARRRVWSECVLARVQQSIPCERCGAEASLVAQLPPLSGTAGARVYRCQACSHHTWISWHSPLPDPALQPQNDHRQQQQQQPKFRRRRRYRIAAPRTISAVASSSVMPRQDAGGGHLF